jgi:hypothetical protein
VAYVRGRHRVPSTLGSRVQVYLDLMQVLVGLIFGLLSLSPFRIGDDPATPVPRVTAVPERSGVDEDRPDRSNLDRDQKKHASQVSLEWLRGSRDGRDVVDGDAGVRITNRSIMGIMSYEILFDHDPVVGGDGMADGTASASSLVGIPGCTSVVVSLPRDFDIADHEGGVLARQRLYAWNLTLLFYHDGGHWQLMAGASPVGEDDAGYSPRLNAAKTDIGTLVERSRSSVPCVVTD